jgi:hypothetical protein
MFIMLSFHRLAARSSGTITTAFPFPLASTKRFYFTNGDRMKKEDPYQTLGLQWGDGATSSEIKQAFRERARLLHPDVNTTDPPHIAQEKFQQLTKAFDTLMKTTTTAGGIEQSMDTEEWRFSVWRQGDRIAIDRDDVAGVKRKRPIQPAATAKSWAAGQLGHPDGRGVVGGRAEYIGAGTKQASSVGQGRSKWVQPKEYTPWNPETEKHERKSNTQASSLSTTIATSTSSTENKS